MPASLANMIPSRPRRKMAVHQYGFGGSNSSGAAASTNPTVRSIAASGNLVTSDEYLLINATTDKAITLNTPTGTRRYNLKIIAGDGVVTLTPASGTIDGAVSYAFSGDQATLGLLFDGTNWQTFLA